MTTETLPTELAIYSARPTVQVDGELYPLVSELIVGMELIEQAGGLAALELRLSNVASDPQGGAGLAFEDDRVLRLGAAIVVAAGEAERPQEIFSGVITGLEARFPAEGAPELTVLAEDRLQQARMARRTQTHVDVSLADLATALAERLGLRPVVTGLNEVISVQAQLDESDLAFLRRLLARYDADMQVVGEELHVSPRGEVRRGELELQLHGQLRSARALADLAHQVTAVTMTGWDARRGERIAVTSTGAAPGPGNGRDGATLLRDALGERAHHLGHLAVADEAEATALADAAFDARARRLVTLEGLAEGNPALRVGAHVQIGGLGPRFDNRYYVVRTCHRFDLERGYETAFEAECAFLGA